jgi:hypothetical protein
MEMIGPTKIELDAYNIYIEANSSTQDDVPNLP